MPATTQPRLSVADQLERLTMRFDELTHRARLGTRDGGIEPRLLEDLEEEARGISRDLHTAFRGRPGGAAPTAPPLWRSPNGRGMLF